MLRATDILPLGANVVSSAPRTDAYVAKARSYLRDHFAQRLTGVPDADLDEAILDARTRNLSHGLATDRDHLLGLIPVVLLGANFEADPQHRAALFGYGWFGPDGQRPADAPAMLLTGVVESYRDDTASDLAEPARLVRPLQTHFARDHEAEDIEACHALMDKVFPARTRRMSRNDLRDFIVMAQAMGRRFDLTGADLVAHVTLSLYFGVGFAEDPIHRCWAHAPHTDSFASRDDQRLALGAGIQAFVERFTSDPLASQASGETL